MSIYQVSQTHLSVCQVSVVPTCQPTHLYPLLFLCVSRQHSTASSATRAASGMRSVAPSSACSHIPALTPAARAARCTSAASTLTTARSAWCAAPTTRAAPSTGARARDARTAATLTPSVARWTASSTSAASRDRKSPPQRRSVSGHELCSWRGSRWRWDSVTWCRDVAAGGGVG